MALLRNISTVVKKVGGWQQDQLGSGLPLDPNGAAMHLPVDLQPGESIEVDPQSINHPVVVGLARSPDFELIEVDVVPGGQIVSDPSSPSGAVKELVLDVVFGDLAVAATSAVLAMSAIPANSVVIDHWVDVATPFTGGTVSALVVDIGETADPDAIVNDVDIFSGGGIQQGTLVGKDFPAGIDVELEFTATGDNLDQLAAGAASFHVLYVIVE